ncbi:hypothetical protein [Bacillus sp. NPDC077027]|uniref:hypothetical protein n=1 Tax=Bacillus sp. NPDC077027 TaxID=3390548 RepID=UPI003D0099F8
MVFDWTVSHVAEPFTSVQHDQISKIEPSRTGFVLFVCDSEGAEQSSHHNVFFSANDEQEFDDIFRGKQLPNDPPLYICYSGFSKPF